MQTVCLVQSASFTSGWLGVTRGRVETESGGTRRRTGEVKGKEANEVGSQQSSA